MMYWCFEGDLVRRNIVAYYMHFPVENGVKLGEISATVSLKHNLMSVHAECLVFRSHHIQFRFSSHVFPFPSPVGWYTTSHRDSHSMSTCRCPLPALSVHYSLLLRSVSVMRNRCSAAQRCVAEAI
jgi:hypothetical protein